MSEGAITTICLPQIGHLRLVMETMQFTCSVRTWLQPHE